METMTLGDLFRAIALCELGFFGKGKRGRNRAEKLFNAGLLVYWCGSASASYCFKKPVEIRC